MDPRKLMTAAAVVSVVTAASAGCSAGGHRAASSASSPSSATVAPSTVPPTTPPTTVPPTTAPATTSTTLAPTTTTTTTRPAPASVPVTTAVHAAAATCPSNTASALRWTGSARQLITVEAAGWGTTVATVELWQKSGGCWMSAGGPWSGHIGENGFSDHHIEGDSTTPTGAYGVGPVMYGNAPDPGVHEAYHHLVCGDWWDEDPNSPQYNTFQHVPCGQKPPFGGGSEALWQETGPYPSFAVIDYNTGPIVKGAGSGVFFHRDTGGPTVGCVSVPLADLDLTLRWINPADSPLFVMGPASEIDRF